MLKVEPIKELNISNIKEFGSEKNKLIVETVASFINYYNFLNTPMYKLVKDEVTNKTEYIEINFKVEDNPIIELIFKQTLKVIINGEEISNFKKEDILEIFNKYPDLYEKIYLDIKDNSVGRDKGLTLKRR